MKILCLHGISKDAWNRYSRSRNWYYEVLEPGFKYNLSDLQSAIGIHQLRKLEKFTEIRTQLCERSITSCWAMWRNLSCPQTERIRRHAWHLYMLRLNLDKLEHRPGRVYDSYARTRSRDKRAFHPDSTAPIFRALPARRPQSHSGGA